MGSLISIVDFLFCLEPIRLRRTRSAMTSQEDFVGALANSALMLFVV
jgi:hypothetical protein